MSPETFAKYEQDIHLEDEELLGFEKGKVPTNQELEDKWKKVALTLYAMDFIWKILTIYLVIQVIKHPDLIKRSRGSKTPKVDYNRKYVQTN
jgi:hypothetical protein